MNLPGSWIVERPQGMDLLSGGAEAFTARHDDDHARAASEQALHNSRTLPQYVLAVVQKEQHTTRGQMALHNIHDIALGLFRQVEGQGYGCWQTGPVRERAQIYEADLVPVAIREFFSNPETQAGLSAAPGAGQRQQRALTESMEALGDLFLTADE